MIFRGIVALCKDSRMIGNQNSLPWPRNKSDLKIFKEITMQDGGNIIMGRKTYESMGIPYLKGRNTWILTNKNNYGWNQHIHPDNSTVNIFERISELPTNQNYFVAGGLSIYELWRGNMHEIFATYINQDYSGDCKIFEFENDFNKIEDIYICPDYTTKRFSEKK